MNIAYVTNAWGSVTGHPGGICSVKDSFYISTGDNETAIGEIARAGFGKIEIFDGNLFQYKDNPESFTDLLKKNGLALSAVYTAANFIFNEILEEEFAKIESVVAFAKTCGAKHITLGGGAIRDKGRQDSDFSRLAKGLDKAAGICAENGLVASYHPHLGSLVENSVHIDKLMPLTKINLCPDLAHIAAAGSDPVQVVEKYVNRIVHIHLKDFGKGSFCSLGDGEIDIGRVVEIAKAAPHGIDFTVEADGVVGEPLKAAEKSFAYLQKII